jgi:hypothetical protein
MQAATRLRRLIMPDNATFGPEDLSSEARTSTKSDTATRDTAFFRVNELVERHSVATSRIFGNAETRRTQRRNAHRLGLFLCDLFASAF